MIYVDRDSVPMPKLFESERLKMEEEREIIPRLGATKKFKQARFRKDNKLLYQLKPELRELFNNKCCYCESILDDFDIEHFRPISTIRGSNTLQQGYYWLTYKWFNIYATCRECNRHKANSFPVYGEQLRPPKVNLYNEYNNLKVYLLTEDAQLLDPCLTKDHLKLNFEYKADGKMVPRNKRAQSTIYVLQLNREKLTALRRKKYQDISSLLAKYDFFNITSEGTDSQFNILKCLFPNNAYLGLTMQIVRGWLHENRKKAN